LRICRVRQEGDGGSHYRRDNHIFRRFHIQLPFFRF
jgi:hypothetical protein